MSRRFEESPSPTAYAVRCKEHGMVFLTVKAYVAQLQRPDSQWECPRLDADTGMHCGAVSAWDDVNYEAYLDLERRQGEAG